MSGYFTVKEPLAFALVFGGVQGLAVGVLYSVTLKFLLQTMTKQGGMASGVMHIGPVFGALVNIGVAFAVINPSNSKPDLMVDNITYFSDKGLIDRVPVYFIVAGAVTIASTLLGTILMIFDGLSLSQLIKSEPLSAYKRLFKRNRLAAGEGGEDMPLNGISAQIYNAEHELDELSKSSENRRSLDEESEKVSDSEVEKYLQVEEKSSTCFSQADLSPRQAYKTAAFWCVWIAFFSSNHTMYLQLNLYKQYGQQEISDDSLLVTTGIICNAGMMVIRPLVGVAIDLFGTRNTTLALNVSASVFMCLMVVSLHTCPWLYVVSVVIENVGVSPHTLIFSMLTAAEFGKTYYASNMGLISSGAIVLILLEPGIVNIMVSTVGWDWLFLSGSAASIVATVSIIAMDWWP